MRSTPTVAVLLATYNGEKFLVEQLESILSQTYQNIHLYCADDSSTDKTKDILYQFKNQYPEKISLYCHEVNQGYVKNFEFLLKNCSEKYIALSDQDDIWHPEKLDEEMSLLQEVEKNTNNQAVLVHSDLEMINEENYILHKSYFKYRKYKLKNSKDLGHILGPCGVMGNTIVMNSKLKSLILPFPDLLDMHDYWIAVIAELFGHRVTINKPLVQYRIHEKNVSNSKDRLAKKKNSFFSRDIKLANLETNRKKYLLKLLDKVENVEDKQILKKYLEYLNFKSSRLLIFFNLVKFSLVKRDFYFRFKLFFKIMISNRYDSE